MNFINEFKESILKVLGPSEKTIGLHEPHFNGNEWKYVKDCIDTGWVSSVGSYVDKFEKKLCELTGSPYAIAVVNGTSALFLALKVAEVKEQNEVLVPALTFVATANAISHCGAIPHFVDVCDENLGIDIQKLRNYLAESTEMQNGNLYNKKTNNRISAIVPVHIFGMAVKMDELLKLADDFHLQVIEDAAEGMGSFYKHKHLGTIAKIGVLSFNGNKIVTTGGGGAILTSDETLAKKIRHLATTGKRPHSWEFYHDCVAYNFRLPNLNAALGLAQLEQLPEFVENKRTLAMQYQKAFSQLHEVRFLKEPENCKSNYWLNTIILNENTFKFRDQILNSMNEMNIQCRPVWNLMHTLPMYSQNPKMNLSQSEKLAQSIICLPSSVFWGEKVNA